MKKVKNIIKIIVFTTKLILQEIFQKKETKLKVGIEYWKDMKEYALKLVITIPIVDIIEISNKEQLKMKICQWVEKNFK
jgi:hypothetical protein